MPATFNPGFLSLDETSTYGFGTGDASAAPPSDEWLRRVEYWLAQLLLTHVGSVVLNQLEARPSNPRMPVIIVRQRLANSQGFTEGPLRVAPLAGATASADLSEIPEAVYIRYSPRDAWPGASMPSAPMQHAAPVLIHELTHALMGVYRLNDVTQLTAGHVDAWHTWSYPFAQDLCATTVQNMLLSETGSQLARGYTFDHPDPTIRPTLIPGADPTGYGAAATVTLDMQRFVEDYRAPLEYLETNLPVFVSQLAALEHIPFNPFRFMQTSSGSGTVGTPGGASGATRSPGPTELSAH